MMNIKETKNLNHPLASSEEIATHEAQLVELWGNEQHLKAAVKTCRTEQAENKTRLCAELYACRAILARPGRNGGWNEFLRKHNISRATGNRYADAHKEFLEPVKCLTETIPQQLTSEAIKKMATGVHKKYAPKFTTPLDVSLFMRHLQDAFTPAPSNSHGYDDLD